MKRSPNWKKEELLLALDLYMSHDLEWLNKINDKTPEVVALSEVLKQLDLFETVESDSFRSVGSIRMKLANFMALDFRYGKDALGNIGKSDKTVWNEYHNIPQTLHAECVSIIQNHFVGTMTEVVAEYLSRYTVEEIIDHRVDGYRAAYASINNLISLASDAGHEDVKKLAEVLALSLNKYIPEEKPVYVEHGGINQARVKAPEKIGAVVRNYMRELIELGIIKGQTLQNLQSSQWCRNRLHISHPLLKQLDETKSVKEQLRDANGYLRYWKDVHEIDEKKYVICKEWYEEHRIHFLDWIKTLKLDVDSEDLQKILKTILDADTSDVYISFPELRSKFSMIEALDQVLNQFIDWGILIPYQGSLRDYLVDDYEMLYQMLENPDKYIITR